MKKSTRPPRAARSPAKPSTKTSTAKRALKRPSAAASSSASSRQRPSAKESQSSPRAFFVHEKGMAESEDIGEGTRVWAFAHVMKGATIGARCNVGECAFVETGVRLGNHVTIKNGVQLWTGVTAEDYVFIGPNATFTNDLRPRVARPLDPAQFARTHLRQGASIGANATVVAGVTIGRHAMVGAGTVVVRDVPDHALVVGNPARRIGWVCECGERLPEDLTCACGRSYESAPHGLRGRDSAAQNLLARGA